MSQTIDRGTLDRLIALGRARGGLSADDLRAALPVEQMDVDALVLVMRELETAGVSVEPDAFGPPVERPVAPSLVLPAPESEPAPPVRPLSSRLVTDRSTGTPPRCWSAARWCAQVCAVDCEGTAAPSRAFNHHAA